MCSLEVSLQKRSEGPLWSEVVLGNRRGEYLMNDEQKSQLQQKLSYLTAEDLVSFFQYLLKDILLGQNCSSSFHSFMVDFHSLKGS